jgi:dTDP-4-dehydrorhamnose 3,5-epimerase
MKFDRTEIPDVLIVEPRVFADPRGWFMETWERRKFAAGGLDVEFVQDNHSESSRGVLRGLHYQIRQPQGKLVRVTAGEVFDVAVDLRRSSPTFGRWVAAVLSGENRRMMWIPPGFAHGFYVLSDRAEFIYKCTDYYAPEHERSLAWNDARVGVRWPVAAGTEPLLSPKDRAGKPFDAIETFE